MKIGLLGAAFDPPHLGHWQVTTGLLREGLVDAVWWIPVQQHPLAKQVTAAHHRLAMVEAMLSEQKNRYPEIAQQVALETYELTQPGPSYSYQTLQALSSRHPQDVFVWIMGADNLATFSRWHAYDRIAAEFGVLVYPRPGYPMVPLIPGLQPVTSVPEVAISSTAVRAKVKAGDDVSALVSPSVAQYINDHQLYQAG